jgi:tetratricopeptide (TPR) repeat protein
MKGNIFQRLDDNEKAVESYEKCIETSQNDYDKAAVINNKAVCLNKLKRYKEAVDAANLAIDLKPNFSLAYKNKSINNYL